MPASQDLVHETSTGTGIGNFTLAPVNGKQSFSDAFGTGDTDVFHYFISNRDVSPTEWEIGTGHMDDATTLVRDTVLYSSDGGNAIDFTAGTKDVTNDEPAEPQGFRGQRPGTTTNDSAALGNVGEYLSAGVDSASAVTLTNNVAANVTSLQLTAGDWDVTAIVKFRLIGAVSCTGIISAINTVSATMPGDSTTATMRESIAVALTDNTTPSLGGRAQRVSLSTPTTYYLVARASFSAPTVSAWGLLSARRVR